MLKHLGVDTLRMMANNTRKTNALEPMEMVVANMVAVHTGVNPHN